MKQYNYCIDFLKGIACIFVVLMHVEFPGYWGVLVQCVSRFCVPFFFMVSGYFCYYSDGKVFQGKSKVEHILRIIVCASVLYLILPIINWHRTGTLNYANSWELPLYGYLLIWAIFNQPIVIGGHLWFLFALLYDYILFSFIDHRKLHSHAIIFGFLMFGVYIVLAQGMHVVGVKIPNCVYRNFLVEGWAFFMLGYSIHKNQNTFIKLRNSTLVWIHCCPEKIYHNVSCPADPASGT